MSVFAYFEQSGNRSAHIGSLA